MTPEEQDAQAFMMARRLIEEHGEDATAFANVKVDELFAAGEPLEFAKWFQIRNALAIMLIGPDQNIDDRPMWS